MVPTRALDLAQLDLHLLAQLGVEIGERLVEQQDARLDDQRAGQRDALLLAARHAPRKAVGEGGEADQRQASRLTRASRSALATPRISRPNATFSAAVMCGNSA